MSEPLPGRLCAADTQPVRASAVLSAEAKLVWMEDWTLDRGGEGCWLSHAQLGARLGMTENAVQHQRANLLELGLYHRMKRPGARSPGWRPTWPVDLPALATQRPAPDEVTRARDFLDRHLRNRPGGGLKPPLSRTKTATGAGSADISTAFDSQVVEQPSPAFGVEGTRDGARAPEAKAVEAKSKPDSGITDSVQRIMERLA